MELKDKLSQVEESAIFAEWKKKNKDSYLAHIFRMYDEPNINTWQFGYYNSDDTITTFILDSDTVREIPQEEIFKKTKKKLVKLNMEEVNLDFSDAMNIAKKLHDEKYSVHPIINIIAILQVIGKQQVFNITFITKTFYTVNVHVDSNDKNIVHEKLTSLMSMAKFENEKKENRETNYIG